MKLRSIGERKFAGIIFAFLLFHLGKVHRAAIYTYRCTRFQFLCTNTDILKLVGENKRSALPYSST